MHPRSPTLILTAVLASLSAGINAQAQFAYHSQDLLLNFRPTDAGATDPNLTVNLGPIENYYNRVLNGQPIQLNQFIDTSLSTLFGNLDNLAFSAGAGEPGSGQDFPQGSVWMTRPRSNPSTQTAPWTAYTRTSSSQGSTAGKVNSTGSGAVNVGADFSDTSTQVPNGDGASYFAFMTTSGRWGSSYQGVVEKLTGTGFTGSKIVRSDLHEMLALPSGSKPGNYLGYIELQADGDVLFVPVPEPATYGALAGLGLLGVTLRSQLRRKQS